MIRKTFLPLIVAAAVSTGMPTVSDTRAEDKEWISFSSLVGESKYAGGKAEHYAHVNPDAPKGGTLNSIATGTFDSFNPFIIKGTTAAGLNYQGGLLYDNLMDKSVDEPSASYPLIAEAYSHPDDYSSATYRLNPRAKWHDGKPITPEDVAWSMEMLKQHSPQYNRYFANVKETRIDGPHEVTFIFDQKNNRELPLIMGDLPVLPKHWWEGKDASGKQRDITNSTLEPPLGSGPYKIERFSAGSSIIWKRVEDYWAADTFTRKGRFNFDEIKFTYFKDQNADWQAFTKGGFEDYRLENRSQKWANEYTFPAVKAGDVVKKEFDDGSGYPMQAWTMNTRRDAFKDRRVREAINYAFNFEEMNKNLFYGFYTRSRSYFGGRELEATGLPEGRELEILEEVRDEVPPEVFTAEYNPPQFKERADTRANLRKAFDLLKEAGWENKGGKLVDGSGKQMKIEFLAADPTAERVTGPFINNLRRLGIDASLRIVDPSQYIKRVQNFDFDIVSTIQAQSASPGNEQREYWSTQAADQPGSRNYAGIKNPAVDKLIAKIIFAKDRAELVAATKALDRVLVWNHYNVPQWYNSKIWIAHWNKFEIPLPQPEYLGVDPYSWWIDTEREKVLNAKYN